jgi:RNA polymerase sigma factor (sigma-70 family)
MTNETTPCQEQITFDELYQNQSKNIFLYAYYSMKLSEEDAKDVMHEAFLLLFEIWLDFEPKIYPAAIVWLRTTIQNLVYDKNIKAQKMPTVSLEGIREISDNGMEMRYINTSVYREKLEQIKSKLSEEEYRLFAEITINHRSFQEISQIMNISDGALRVRWHRLRKKIQSFL